jgi:hypothetical protein
MLMRQINTRLFINRVRKVFWAKKWTKIGPHHVANVMLLGRTRRTPLKPT